ncbi:hypothetical protein EIP86_005775, partial [Pleurotus ostreatoroseus]
NPIEPTTAAPPTSSPVPSEFGDDNGYGDESAEEDEGGPHEEENELLPDDEEHEDDLVDDVRYSQVAKTNAKRRRESTASEANKQPIKIPKVNKVVKRDGRPRHKDYDADSQAAIQLAEYF